jgi:lipoic acid synthetase
VESLLRNLRLDTVCQGAQCPNRSECYAAGTATFLILGTTCTRNCRFCAIENTPPPPPRDDEPHAIAHAVRELNLHYVVLTSVTRDDLPDGGARHFARTLHAIRSARPDVQIEVLTPDFQGNENALQIVLDARPDVFNHNIETVARLYPTVRPEANYAQSLTLLAAAKRLAPGTNLLTKSGLMAGVGETNDDVLGALANLRDHDVDIVTIGQYLAPSDAHLPVARFVEPEQFAAWEQAARGMGFQAVAAGPFVRSSYHAKELFPHRPL